MKPLKTIFVVSLASLSAALLLGAGCDGRVTIPAEDVPTVVIPV